MAVIDLIEGPWLVGPQLCRWRPRHSLNEKLVIDVSPLLLFMAAFFFFVFFFVSNQCLYFPAQLVGGFTLSDLLHKPWSQVSSLLPPGMCLQLLFERSEFLIHTPQKKNLYRLYGNKRLHVDRVFD